MSEKKAYDFKELAKKYKEAGLEVTEEAAKALTVSTIEWLDESAEISPNVIDDMARIVYPEIKKRLLALEENINPND